MPPNSQFLFLSSTTDKSYLGPMRTGIVAPIPTPSVSLMIPTYHLSFATYSVKVKRQQDQVGPTTSAVIKTLILTYQGRQFTSIPVQFPHISGRTFLLCGVLTSWEIIGLSHGGTCFGTVRSQNMPKTCDEMGAVRLALLDLRQLCPVTSGPKPIRR